MRITIIAEKKLTHNVIVVFKNIFAMSGLGRSFHVLLNEDVDVLAAICAVANLDGVGMVAQMNANTLNGVIAVDIEDFGVAWCNALGRLFTNSAH
jgi:hypothetical protein